MFLPRNETRENKEAVFVWVKICGTTSLEDALVAVEAGADALGFIFAESPRRVTPEAAADIVRRLHPVVEKVGVFVNESAEHIEKIVQQVGLTGVQLHGHQTFEIASRLAGRAATLRVIPAFPIALLLQALEDDKLFHLGPSDTVLFDTAAQGKHGGTGQTWDWEEGKWLINTLRERVRVIVAGGLTSENVGGAIHTLRPWGVDVVSGVEREPGKKDPEKVRSFVKAAKQENL